MSKTKEQVLQEALDSGYDRKTYPMIAAVLGDAIKEVLGDFGSHENTKESGDKDG